MIVGIPKGLFYYQYHYFIEEFLDRLDTEYILSDDTNKNILNDGIKYCVDEACLPIKIFHGHVASLKDKCDLIIVPRIMKVRDNEFICPKFCGLPEMIKNSIENLPEITSMPIYLNNYNKIYKWCSVLGKKLNKRSSQISYAFNIAVKKYKSKQYGINDIGYKYKVALLGHPYNIYDPYSNMNVVKKLNKEGIGIITHEIIDEKGKIYYAKQLFKKPFWSFIRDTYGSALSIAKQNKVDGIVYISSFACGIDSVIVELITDSLDNFPVLILKIDEQTGEAGLNTRIEAFVDMLKRRRCFDSNLSTHGKYLYSD